MNLKNARIQKLAEKGLTPEQIAKKLGLKDTTRVLEGLKWLKENHG